MAKNNSSDYLLKIPHPNLSLIRENAGCNPQDLLFEGAKSNITKLMQLAIYWGADLDHEDSDGWTALHWAARQRHAAAVQLLLEAGADIDKVNPDMETEGYTALHLVAEAGYPEIASLLIKMGADINKVDNDGYTPLMVAAAVERLGVMEILLNAGADIDQFEIGRETLNALLLTAYCNSRTALNLLLKAGAGLYASISTISQDQKCQLLNIDYSHANSVEIEILYPHPTNKNQWITTLKDFKNLVPAASKKQLLDRIPERDYPKLKAGVLSALREPFFGKFITTMPRAGSTSTALYKLKQAKYRSARNQEKLVESAFTDAETNKDLALTEKAKSPSLGR